MIGSVVLILLAVLLGVAGELLLKAGIDSVGELHLSGFNQIVTTVKDVFTHPRIILGFIAYGTASLMWLVVLSRFDLSFAYPMLALTYVFVPLAAKFFLHESIPAGRWLGIVVVIVGVVIVAWYGQGE
jgi:drug/metabolite transporter (DMT)-like permease